MKKTLLAILLCAFCLAASTDKAAAQTTLVHFWHFNNDTAADDTLYILPSTIVPVGGAPGYFNADYTRITAPTASMVIRPEWPVSSEYPTLFDIVPAADVSDTVNSNPVGFFGTSPVTAGNILKARNRCDSMELLFYIPTTNYQNINFSFGLEMSSTHGAWYQNFQYSADSGMTWQTSGLSVTADTCSPTNYTLVSVNITDPSANDNRKLVFQITFNQNDTFTAYAGNDRFDNISVTADTSFLAVPTPKALPNFEGAITMSPNPATDYIDLNTPEDMDRTIMIYDATGKSVFAGLRSAKTCRLDISKYAAGTYYVKVTALGSKNTQTLKFVKE